MLVIFGIIHLLPLSGVIGSDRLQLARVFMADLVVLACLLVGIAALLTTHLHSS